jgi:hypothetical protein
MTNVSTSREEWEIRAGELEVGTTLTTRQAQVQALMEEGRTNQQICAELEIAEPTLFEHKRNITTAIRESRATLDEIADDRVLSAEEMEPTPSRTTVIEQARADGLSSLSIRELFELFRGVFGEGAQFESDDYGDVIITDESPRRVQFAALDEEGNLSLPGMGWSYFAQQLIEGGVRPLDDEQKTHVEHLRQIRT